MIEYLRRHPEKVAGPLVEHIELVLITLAVSLAIASLLTLLAMRSGKVSDILNNTFSVIYSIPSLALFALLLYRNRRMESVSDIIVIPALKPIFRACMGFGGALLFSAIAFENFFRNSVFGRNAAWMMAILLLFGAFLGWLAAEMMIRRTVRVFPLPWKGLCLICLVCMLMVLAAETDVTGYEKRVPDMNRVDHVEFCYDTVYTEPENIRLVTELHRELIADKQMYDGNSEGTVLYGDTAYHADGGETEELNTRISFWVPITYVLQNGRTVQRVYIIRFTPHDVDRPNTTIGRIVSLLNTQEGIQSRMKTALPMKENRR